MKIETKCEMRSSGSNNNNNNNNIINKNNNNSNNRYQCQHIIHIKYRVCPSNHGHKQIAANSVCAPTNCDLPARERERERVSKEGRDKESVARVGVGAASSSGVAAVCRRSQLNNALGLARAY